MGPVDQCDRAHLRRHLLSSYFQKLNLSAATAGSSVCGKRPLGSAASIRIEEVADCDGSVAAIPNATGAR